MFRKKFMVQLIVCVAIFLCISVMKMSENERISGVADRFCAVQEKNYTLPEIEEKAGQLVEKAVEAGANFHQLINNANEEK